MKTGSITKSFGTERSFVILEEQLLKSENHIGRKARQILEQFRCELSACLKFYNCTTNQKEKDLIEFLSGEKRLSHLKRAKKITDTNTLRSLECCLVTLHREFLRKIKGDKRRVTNKL